MKRILSLDGGGIRGALSLGYLQKVESILAARSAKPDDFRLYQYFDLIGGTSTGSIIAAALAIGMSVKEIKDKYFELGEVIFGKKYDWWKPWETRKYLKAGFDYAPLEAQLKDVFKSKVDDTDQILLGSDEILTNLCVVAKRADTNSTWLLNNNPDGQFYRSDIGENADIPLWQAIRASTAAPTYFVPELVHVGNGITGAFVDGGVSSSNNPALDLFRMVTMSGYRYSWPVGEGEIFLLSIGTGNGEYFMKTNEITDNWLLQWAKEIPNMLMADASWGNQTMLQWLSNCLTPREIDMEIGDLANECLTEEPLLTYSRFNAVLSTGYLNGLKIQAFNEDDVDSLKDMSEAKNCEILFRIGETAGRSEITEEHLPTKFDV